MEIPVYLFLGFLESGKTKFMQSTMEDTRFHTGESTLIVLCEEGEEELDTSKFKGGNVHIVTIEDVSEMTTKFFESNQKKYKAERVLIEYNGMWSLNDLGAALPNNWQIYQIMMMADARSFNMFNSNMRQLMYEKLSVTEVVAFNRCPKDVDKQALHAIVRSANRKADILYEYEDGEVEYDDIVDELPFDLKAPIVEIKDEDFALLYADAMETPEKYDGLTVKFRALVAKNVRLPKGYFIAGRFCMTCCEADIKYYGFLCDNCGDQVKNKQWVMLTAKVKAKRHSMFGNEIGPMFTVVSVTPTSKPEEEVAAF